MRQEILENRELVSHIESFTLTPSGGGVFEFTANGTLLFSKKALGRHTEPGEIRKLLEELIAN
ncbi:MAG: Rdx family protein [Anaerolineales bacterium]|nr:Rdx family protein [Anaerolineales bacterium]